MEELELLYKELQERQKHLESRKKTKTTEGRIAENLLTMVRVQQLLIPLVVGRSEQLPSCDKCGYYIHPENKTCLREGCENY